MPSATPNVVVFLTDQQRWDTVGLHGNPMGLTPNLDRLARRGTHLASTFTPQPLCAPARAALQTGMYAAAAGVHRNGLPLPEDATTLARSFTAAGYRTGYIGKWHLGGEEPVSERNRGGYQDWLAANTIELVSDAYRCVLFDGENRPVRLPGYRVDAVVDAAIRYVDAHRAEPFFLFLSLLEPHQQNSRDDFVAPDGDYERHLGCWTPPDLAALPGNASAKLPGYYGMVRRIDAALGRLQDALRSLDLADRTIVLFTSDHGCHFKTRNDEYKRSCHEASIRVPAALWGPGFDGGGRVESLVSLIDLPPTLLEAAGLPVPPTMQGRSLLPILHGTSGNGAARKDGVLVQVSETDVGRAIRTSRWKYYVHAPEADPVGDARSWLYQERHLYDLWADPCELNDLAGLPSHAGIAGVLRGRLQELLARSGETDAKIRPAASRPGGRGLRPAREEAWL